MQISHQNGRSSDSCHLYQLIGNEIKTVLQQIGVTDMQVCNKFIRPQGEGFYTVYTSTYGAYNMRLAFSAEWTLLDHIAEVMLCQPVSEEEDVIDCAKEFFNVVCGHVVATIFKATKTSARFGCPCFEEGLSTQNCDDAMLLHCFINEQQEAAVFMHDPLTTLQM